MVASWATSPPHFTRHRSRSRPRPRARMAPTNGHGSDGLGHGSCCSHGARTPTHQRWEGGTCRPLMRWEGGRTSWAPTPFAAAPASRPSQRRSAAAPAALRGHLNRDRPQQILPERAQLNAAQPPRSPLCAHHTRVTATRRAASARCVQRACARLGPLNVLRRARACCELLHAACPQARVPAPWWWCSCCCSHCTDQWAIGS